MKLMFLLLTVILVPEVLFSRNDTIEVRLENKVPKYISITDVFVAPGHYFEEPVNDYYAGFKYRAIITVSEIYSSLYIEKITMDIEGSTMKILWTKVVDIKSVLDYYNLSQETTVFENFCWQNFNTFKFSFAGMKFFGRLDIDERDLISICKIIGNSIQ